MKKTKIQRAREQAHKNNKFLLISIVDLGLPVRVVNILNARDIHRIGDLVQCTERDVLNIKGIGCESRKKIKEALTSYNFSLGLKLHSNWCE